MIGMSIVAMQENMSLNVSNRIILLFMSWREVTDNLKLCIKKQQHQIV